MRSILLAFAVVFVSEASLGETPQSIDQLSTHQQVGVIAIDDGDNPLKINAFCLSRKGQIVAACGTGPGEIRIVNDNGEVLHAWEIGVRPESVNVADDGSILVGGEGKLFRYSGDGEQLLVADSPHAEHLRSNQDNIRQAAIADLTRKATPLGSRVKTYELMMKQLEARAATGELNDAEKRMLTVVLPKLLEQFQEPSDVSKEDNDKPPSEEAIQKQMESLIRTKMKISSITSTGDHVFVATRSGEGYGYDVWKMNHGFSDGKVIVSGLRGCCGQMDVQCCKQGMFVAENSRDRVVHYDLEGNEITNWGKSDRTGINGFASCCNPMNVTFDDKGYVYTAEASVGRVKQFNAAGELTAYIGDVDLVPGCKNVSIGVSQINDNIYMLDLTRNHIKLMQPKTKDAAATPPAEETTRRESDSDPENSNVASVVDNAAGGSNE